ncbi:MAG: bifunctional oligoribonuclease/PAP phosphatase NrnA [Clostridia bacterium]|nr:bifunctional oligoribonuclease/PAP phosphatase NrnA [Clostridia bacterium]
MFEQILDKIEQYDTIIIHRHSYPDGDALGSQIGLKHLILANYPTKCVYIVGDYTTRYSFMDDCIMDSIDDSAYEGALAIILDTGASHLIADSRYALAREGVRMDHHIFCEKIVDTEIVDTSYESCCGLVTACGIEAGWTFNVLASQSLYTGLVTDSGRFRYDSTTPRTFMLASKLLEQPIDISSIYSHLYADDFDMIRLRAQFVLKIAFTEHNVAYIYTPDEQIQQLSADPFDISRGMVGTMSDIKGVDIWVNFTEHNGSVLCEIRSSKYNINPVAVKYGGGGHAKASGATLANRQQAMQMLDDLDRLSQE